MPQCATFVEISDQVTCDLDEVVRWIDSNQERYIKKFLRRATKLLPLSTHMYIKNVYAV